MKSVFLFSLLIAVSWCGASGARAAEGAPEFRVWAVSCAHVPADIRRGRESLVQAIRQSEGRESGAPAFDWDIMIDAGDLSAHQTPPGDRDGKELIRQYRAMEKHRREQIYNVQGNHDAPYYDHGPGSWFRKWGDPVGENTEFSGVDPQRRPFPVEGNWERYRFVAGNVLFLMLSDRNDAPNPVGRGHSRDGKSGGYPPGAVTRDTFNWWKRQVLANQDKIIVTMHHHALRDTTTASGHGEGNPRYHGSTGGAEGSSYLYFIIENDDPEDFKFTPNAHVFEDFLEEFHRGHGRGAIDLWIGGHTHVKGPDDDWGGKTISERKWGVGFLQVAALTKHHGGAHPLSRLLTFTDGSDELRAQVYLHEATFEDHPVGFYPPATKVWRLRHKFVAPPPIKPLPPFPAEARVFDEPYVHERDMKGRKGVRERNRTLTPTGPSPDLTGRWKRERQGGLQLEEQLRADTGNRIDSKPSLAGNGPLDKGPSMKFDGAQRVRVGEVDMADWTDLTVTAWINTRKNTPGMRIVSKDWIGEPGCFMFWQSSPGAWTMQAWDGRAGRWQVATWRSDSPSDGRWHHLAGVVDGAANTVRLYVDGQEKAAAQWTAETLDDSDKADVAVGADSGKEKFGHAFEGLIHDVRIYPRALRPAEIEAMAGVRKR